jgi:hypothetical protein
LLLCLLSATYLITTTYTSAEMDNFLKLLGEHDEHELIKEVDLVTGKQKKMQELVCHA